VDLREAEYDVRGLGKVNVLLGKNGCGKSTLLKAVEASVAGRVVTQYITPERGGSLKYASHIEQNISNDPAWLVHSRRANQFEQFRQQTVYQYRLLELQVLRAIEAHVKAKRDGEPELFDTVVDRVNALLDNIQVARNGTNFDLVSKRTGGLVNAENISSGEAELVSLGIECLYFAMRGLGDAEKILFLDEPDVHLHPDLQVRFAHFVIDLVERYSFRVIIATHSTALLSALNGYHSARFALMRSGDRFLDFKSVDDEYRKILPVFGAHPLSNVFNQTPILLVEGEDDERIWQQAVRSANGRIKLYPVVCETVSAMHGYETKVNSLVEAVYDNAKAYSLRDGDDDETAQIDDLGPVVRMKLACRAAENLLLSSEVLHKAGVDWDTVRERIENWLAGVTSHPKHAAVAAFRDGGYNRRWADLKEIRMLMVGDFMASNKPWEVLVGQVLASLKAENMQYSQADEHSIHAYLGAKVVSNLLPCAA
jgi:predicted ATPase